MFCAAPLGFFDPVGFAKDISPSKLKFYKEVEIKHGRLAMIAAVGFPIGEHISGATDVPSYIAFEESPLAGSLPVLALPILLAEIFSVFTFNSPFGGELFSIRTDYENGNLGFDPLGLKPEDPEDLKDMKTKEINNGRLAMIGIVGMLGQELSTNAKLW